MKKKTTKGKNKGKNMEHSRGETIKLTQYSTQHTPEFGSRTHPKAPAES